MASNAVTVAELPISTSLATTDRLVVVYNATTTANVHTITASNFMNSIPAKYIRAGAAPSTSSSSGLPGEIAYDGNYVYICIAENVWRRSPLSDW